MYSKKSYSTFFSALFSVIAEGIVCGTSRKMYLFLRTSYILFRFDKIPIIGYNKGANCGVWFLSNWHAKVIKKNILNI